MHRVRQSKGKAESYPWSPPKFQTRLRCVRPRNDMASQLFRSISRTPLLYTLQPCRFPILQLPCGQSQGSCCKQGSPAAPCMRSQSTEKWRSRQTVNLGGVVCRGKFTGMVVFLQREFRRRRVGSGLHSHSVAHGLIDLMRGGAVIASVKRGVAILFPQSRSFQTFLLARLRTHPIRDPALWPWLPLGKLVH